MTESNIDDKPFTVQVGKRYVRRDGKISGVIEYFTNTSLDYGAYTLWANGHSYTYDGRYIDINQDDRHDLISEYKEPTAEPQDEWGPWMYPSNEYPERPYIFEGIETVYRDGNLHKWRIKKEPEAYQDAVWINRIGFAFTDPAPEARKAIITTQGNNISIKWAEGEDQ